MSTVSTDHFCHSSSGIYHYDVDEDGRHWAFLLCDKEIVDYYCWFARRSGMMIYKGSSRGAHVTFVRGEQPNELWGKHQGEVSFLYSNIIRTDNGAHAWIDVWCPELHTLREQLGLFQKAKMSFHMTLGRTI